MGPAPRAARGCGGAGRGRGDVFFAFCFNIYFFHFRRPRGVCRSRRAAETARPEQDASRKGWVRARGGVCDNCTSTIQRVLRGGRVAAAGHAGPRTAWTAETPRSITLHAREWTAPHTFGTRAMRSQHSPRSTSVPSVGRAAPRRDGARAAAVRTTASSAAGRRQQRSRARAARWVPPQQLGRCACRRRSRRPGGARAGHVRRAAQLAAVRAHA